MGERFSFFDAQASLTNAKWRATWRVVVAVATTLSSQEGGGGLCSPGRDWHSDVLLPDTEVATAKAMIAGIIGMQHS